MSINSINVAGQFKRLFRGNLDPDMVFNSMALFEAYIATGPAFVGQILSVRTDENEPLVFVINEDFTFSPIGSGDGGDIAAAITAHNNSTTAHADIRNALGELSDKIDGILDLGLYAGTFSTKADLPINISFWSHISVNDFAYVRVDETQDDNYTRYVVLEIDENTGDITWDLNRVWQAGEMGGTFDDVIAGATINVTNPVGGLTVGSTITNTETLLEVFRRMLNPRVPAQYMAPTLSLSGTAPLQREIGENVTPTLTPNFNAGDSGGATEYRLSRDGSVIHTAATPIAHADTAFQLVANRVYQSAVDFAQGPIKNDSEGNPDPIGRIEAGTVTSGNVTYTPVRRSFFGALTDGTIPDNTAFIRALPGSQLNAGNNTVMAVDVAVGQRGAVFAYPATLRSPTSIIQAGLGSDVKGLFTEIIVPVEGANGFTPIDYRVIYLLPEFPFTGATERFTLTI